MDQKATAIPLGHLNINRIENDPTLEPTILMAELTKLLRESCTTARCFHRDVLTDLNDRDDPVHAFAQVKAMPSARDR